MEISTPVALIVGAAIGALPALWAVYSNRKQRRADVMGRIVKAAESIVKQLEDRLETVETENKQLHIENTQFRVMIQALEIKVDIIQRKNVQQESGIQILITQLKAEGRTPIWKPETEEPKDGDN
jgi:hypothetical protein